MMMKYNRCRHFRKICLLIVKFEKPVLRFNKPTHILN